MRTILLATLILFAPVARGQQVSPVISEFHIKRDKPVHGFFSVRNLGTSPLVVTIQPMSFDHHNGPLRLVPLEKSILLRLGETSFVLPPKGSRTVYWDARCETLPCYFQLFSTIVSGVHVDNGLQVALHIPSVVYVCDRGDHAQKKCRDYVRHVIFGEPLNEANSSPPVPVTRKRL